MGNAIVLWIHIVAATLFVGPQGLLFIGAVPAMRTIEDVEVRARATRTITTRFGWLGGAALLVLIITGIGNYIHADNQGLLDIDRYFVTLQIKLTLVAVVVVLTAVHGAVLGRRLLRLQESGAPPEEVEAVRRWSIVLSVVLFAVSIAILLCAALLGSDWSKQ
jgi:uncharacterized membrane protein